MQELFSDILHIHEQFGPGGMPVFVTLSLTIRNKISWGAVLPS
jgi:hypothetical protein